MLPTIKEQNKGESRAGEKVSAAVKEPCSSSDLCIAQGELPHLMACQDSRKGWKGN